MDSRLLLIVLVLSWCSTFVTAKDENLLEISNKMTTEITNDIKHTNTMYVKIKQDEAVLAELKDSVRRQLKTKNSRLLASTLCAGGSSEIRRRVKDQIEMFFEFYEEQLIENILHEAMEQIYGCKTPSQMVDLLWAFYRDGNLSTFELMTRAQLELFSSTVKRQLGVDKSFQLKFAFNLFKIKQSKLYPMIDITLKQKINHLITQLPTNLQYLLFYSHFCLMNEKYSEYIYTAMTKGNLDASSRYIWAWYETWSIDDTGHIKANAFESNIGNTTELLVQLKGTKYDVYYFIMPQSKLVAAWDLSTEPVNYIWNIEFIDNDRVAFSQDDNIMCSTDEKHDTERRQLRAYKRGNDYNSKSSECQWLLGTCDRRTQTQKQQ